VRIKVTRRNAATGSAATHAGLNEDWIQSARVRGRAVVLREILAAYALAIVGVPATLWLRLGMGFHALGPPALILSVVPILCAAHLGGLFPGLLATTLAVLLTEFFLLPPLFSLRVEQTLDAEQLFALALVGVLASVLSAARIRARHRLDAARILHAVTLASIGDAVIVTDLRGRIRFLNPKAVALTGWPRAEAETQQLASVFRIVNETTQLAVEDPVGKVLAATGPVGVAYHTVLVARDGSRIPIGQNGAPIRVPGGTLAGVVLVFHDRTEERLLELGQQRQIELLDRLAKIAMSVPGVICAVRLRPDGSTCIPVASPAFLDLSGLTPEAVAEDAMPWLARIHPDDLAGVRDGALHSARVLTRWHAAFRYRHPLKGMRWIEANSVPQTEPDGSTLWHGFLADVTERTTMEQQLRQAQQMEAVGTLTGGLAHDFNNLLGVIIANLDLVRGSVADDADAAEFVDDAIEASLRGAELTQRLLAFARRQPLRPVHVVPNDLITDMVKLLGRTLGEAIQITLDLAPDLWATAVDPGQLEVSLTNLATNARDAMPKGGRLSIVTGNRHLGADYVAAHPDVAPGDYVMIEVSDNGTGMPPEVQARIFEPFFSTKRAGESSGLGLSMVFGFVKQSNGHVSAYSELRRGTTMRLYLPRANEGATAVPAEALPPAPGHGEVVLVVEDNASLRRVVVRQVRDLGYQAIEADGPRIALALLGAERIDLLFSDVVMPGPMDGFELADEVARRWPETKVLLTSGFPGAAMTDRLEAYRGSIRLLGKPYRREELAQALRLVLYD